MTKQIFKGKKPMLLAVVAKEDTGGEESIVRNKDNNKSRVYKNTPAETLRQLTKESYRIIQISHNQFDQEIYHLALTED